MYAMTFSSDAGMVAIGGMEHIAGADLNR